MNLGRRVALLAGLPDDACPGTTVNRFCASSLQTIRMAFHAIKAGEGDAFVAGGRRVDLAGLRATRRTPTSSIRCSPAATDAITNVYIPMGITAENVAERYGVARDEMDRFAQRSQERAVAAQAGRLLRRAS